MREEENFIIFSDIKALFWEVKWIVLIGAVIFGLIGIYQRSQKRVCYKVTAIFKEVRPMQMHFSSSNLSSFLASIGVGAQVSEGHAILLSAKILGPVIERLGMQAEVLTDSKLKRKKRLIKESLEAEKGRSLPSSSSFIFSNVNYLGEHAQKYILFFISKDLFEVRDIKNRILASGLVGTAISINGVNFTIEKTPSDLKMRHCYPLTFTPLLEKVMTLKTEIEVNFHMGEESLLQLKMVHHNRKFAMRILDEIMKTYQSYLEKESIRITDGQLDSLVKRRDEYMEKMEDHLKVHVEYLKENLENKGALNLGQQIPEFQSRKQELANDLMGIDLKLSQLWNASPQLAINLGDEVTQLQGELHKVSKEQDALMLALACPEHSHNHIAKQIRYLAKIEQEELFVKTGVHKFFSTLLLGIKHAQDRKFLEIGKFENILLPDASKLRHVQQEKQNLVKLAQGPSIGTLSEEYLKSQIRLLSLEEGTLKQRLFHRTSREKEYQGIDLETARCLHLRYIQQKDQAKSTIQEMIFAKEQLDKENAEWVAIAAIFPDPLCQELVREMGEMKKILRKRRLLTVKERQRIEKKIAQKKQDLLRHVDQTIALAVLEKERNEGYIISIRLAILDLLGQESSIIEKQIQDRIEENLDYLKKKKNLIKGQIDKIQGEMKNIPDTWLKEHRLKFAADMNKGMLEALVQLVESKSIEQNLSMLESGPLESAYGNIAPKSPLLKIFGLIGGLVGGLITFAICFMYFLYKGFPLTIQNMKVRGKKIVAPIKKNDLAGLRRLSLILKKEKNQCILTCLVMGKKGYDFTLSFAQLLSKEGKKVLVIDLNFNNKGQDHNNLGLSHYLEGKSQAPIICEQSYGDYVAMGKYSIFGDEILQNCRFEYFLKEKKEEYDVILLKLYSNLQETLPKTFFRFSDVMILRLENASFSKLKPYFEWECSKHSLAFV